MSKALAGLLTAIGAGASGYGVGKQQFRENQRQDARDARETTDFDNRMTDRNKALKLESDLIDSQKLRTPDIATNTGATYGSDDMIGQDNRENARAAAATGTDIPTIAPTGYVANGQTYPNMAAAQGTLMGQNSEVAQAQRAAQVMRDHGQIEKAQQYDEFAKKHIAEGADKLLSTISGSAPSVAAVKKAGGTVNATIGAAPAELYNKTGGTYTVSADTPVQHYIDKDAAGREFVNSRVIGKDGTPVVDDVKTATRFLTDAKTRAELEQGDTRTFQTGQQITEAGRHNKAEEGIQRQSAATAAAHLGIARDQFNLDKTKYEASTPVGQLKAIELASGEPMTADQKMSKLGIDKLSQVDRLEVASILKSQEHMDTAKAKAMSEGMWQPDSAGAKEMATSYAAMNMKLNRVLSRYGNGKGPAPDPAGILGADSAPAAKPAARNGTFVANPLRESSVPQTWRSPTEVARSGLDAALGETARQLAVANSTGNTAEVARLNDIFAQQSAAKQALGAQQ